MGNQSRSAARPTANVNRSQAAGWRKRRRAILDREAVERDGLTRGRVLAGGVSIGRVRACGSGDAAFAFHVIGGESANLGGAQRHWHGSPQFKRVFTARGAGGGWGGWR